MVRNRTTLIMLTSPNTYSLYTTFNVLLELGFFFKLIGPKFKKLSSIRQLLGVRVDRAAKTCESSREHTQHGREGQRRAGARRFGRIYKR